MATPADSAVKRKFGADGSETFLESADGIFLSSKKGGLPFAPKFLQINSPPVFFFVIFTGIRCGVDIAQKPNKSGQILDQRWKILFAIFTKLIPRRIFLYCKNVGVDGKQLLDTFRVVFRIFFRVVQTVFQIEQIIWGGGNFILQMCRPNLIALFCTLPPNRYGPSSSFSNRRRG